MAAKTSRLSLAVHLVVRVAELSFVLGHEAGNIASRPMERRNTRALMPVYVDDMKAAYGRMVMCHMVADTEAELHAMADLIGVERKWYQYPYKSRYPHYDIALSKRALAVANRALEIRWRDAPAICRRCIESLQIKGKP